jgi:hypothetical protein
MGVSGQYHAPAALYHSERTPGTHWIGGWAGLTVGLDIKAREKSFVSAGNQTLVFWSVLEELAQLVYPDYVYSTPALFCPPPCFLRLFLVPRFIRHFIFLLLLCYIII